MLVSDRRKTMADGEGSPHWNRTTPAPRQPIPPQWHNQGYRPPSVPRGIPPLVLALIVIVFISGSLVGLAVWTKVVWGGNKLSIYDYGQISGDFLVDNGQQNDLLKCQQMYDQHLSRDDRPFRNSSYNNAAFVRGCLSAR